MPIQKPEFFSGVSAPVEKREKLAVKYDDPLWWEKDNELIKTEFGRLALQSRRRVTFEGGYCDQDHPLQAYANELAKLLPQLEDCRVIVSPFDPSCNACALPDGTFFVTPKLFVRAKTKEAILGVILHEWIHFKREHSKANYDKRRQPSNVDKKDEDYTKARSVMEGISAGRLHEYIADIQGAVIELDKLGFSPLGYKEFLEDLAKREGSSGGGMVHGSSQERVLNITELLASIHLPSTNNPTQLLDGRVTAWVAEKRGIHGFPALHEEMSLVKGTKAKDLMDQQMLEIAGMPLCLVPEALEKRWRELSGRSVFAAVERKSRAFHECFLPPLQALGHRLSSALLEEETVGKKSDESFASDLAASAMYAPHTLLPESDTKGVWHYMRAEFPFIQFRASGIPVFLATAEKLVYEKPGLEKGLFTRRMPLRGVYSDWMVSNFPAVPETVDDCARWWKLVWPMARTGCMVNPAFSEDVPEATSGSDLWDTPASYVKQLFYGWITEIAFHPSVNSGQLETVDYANNSLVVEAHRRIFSHPDAAKAQGESLLAYDKRVEAVVRNIRRIGLELQDLSRYELAPVNSIIRRLVDQFLKIEDSEILDRELKLLRASIDPIQELVWFVILKRIVSSHSLYSSYSEPVKKLVIFDDVDLPHQISKTYRSFLNRRQAMGIRSKERIAISEDRSVSTDLVEYLSNEVDEASTYDDAISELDEVSVKDVLELVKSADIRIASVVAVCGRCAKIDQLLQLLQSFQLSGVLPPDWENSPQLGPLLERLARGVASKELNALSLEERISFGSLIGNPAIKSEYSDWVASESEFTALPFMSKLTYVAGGKKTQARLPGSRIAKSLAETIPVTRDEYHAGFVRVQERIEHLEKEGSYAHGLALFVDEVLPTSKPEDVLEFIRAALITEQDDEPLRSIVLKEVWREREIMKIFNESGKLNDDLSAELSASDTNNEVGRELQRDENRQIGATALEITNGVVEELYRLPDTGKHILLRKLLGGATGLLRTPETKAKLLHVLRNIWITENQDDKLNATIAKIEASLVVDEEWEILYLGLVSLLREQSFKRGNSQQKPWKEVGYLRVLEAELGVAVETETVESWTDVPDKAKDKPWRFPQQWKWYAESKLLREVRDAQKLERTDLTSSRRTSLGFVKEVVSHSSALGVRALQNIEQAVKLSPQEARDFSDVYDRVEGQSRMVALHYAERVWPGIWDVYRTIGARIGGGSLFTVMRGTTHRGEERVIKMLNPNVRFNLNRAQGLYGRSAKRLAGSYGGAYQLVPGLIDDVAASLYAEMELAGFLEKDKDFFTRWNGYGEESGRYRIRVPKSFGPAHAEFIQEEFIVAKNLTRWDELKNDRHDLKSVTRLLAMTYVGQLLQDRALADIHPGNEAVTTDNELVLFDRTLYLELGAMEHDLMSALFMDASEKGRSNALQGYFEKALGSQLPTSVIRSIRKAARSQDARTSQEIMLNLRQAGLKPPLNFVFIVKNLRMIDNMAKKSWLEARND